MYYFYKKTKKKKGRIKTEKCLPLLGLVSQTQGQPNKATACGRACKVRPKHEPLFFKRRFNRAGIAL
jgi:hypothetical protein